MTWVGRTTSTRPAMPSHREWVPEPYMLRALDHLVGRHVAGLALDPGLRKTSITLAAYLQRCEIEQRPLKMLIIAPLRICRRVWRQEAAKWTQFRDIQFSLLHGDKKETALLADADVYLINPEGVDWLASKFFGRSLSTMFDIVVFDELTRFKNSQSDRHKALRPRLKGVRTRWGLTGSLLPNGYMDLFGQMLILDDGAALGRYITHYRDNYFQLDFNGFDYKLMPGAEDRIIKKIAPYWLQMSAEDYLELPQLIEDWIEIELDKKARATYAKMKKDMIAMLPEGVVTAANSAACYSKLSQMANGAVYVGDDKAKISVVHDMKLDALEDLIEELNQRPIAELLKNPAGCVPLLVAYEFNHDIERLRERFGVVDPKTGQKWVPYLGKGTTPNQEGLWIDAWNRNRLPVLFCHPASAGHGLNLQEGNAGHVCWFSPTWDLELWEQFIRRILRSGNTSQHIINHILIVKNSIDELKMAAILDKDTTKGRLLKALNTEIRRDAETLAAGGSAANYRRTEDMVTRLSRPGAAAGAAPSAPQEQARPTPKSWGNKDKPQADQAADGQRERIQEQLQGTAQTETPAAEAPARRSFGRRQEAADAGASEHRLAPNETAAEHLGDEKADPATKPARTRRAAAEPAQAVEVAPVINLTTPDTSAALILQARTSLFVAVAQGDPTMTVEEIVEVSEELWKAISAPF